MDPITDYSNGVPFDAFRGPDRAAWIDGWIGAMLDDIAGEFPNLGWTVVYDKIDLVSVDIDVPAEDADRFLRTAFMLGILDTDTVPTVVDGAAIFNLILCNV